MKRILACLLLLAMCLMAFAACGSDPVEPKDNFTLAKEYLATMYRGKGGKVVMDYDLVGVIVVGDASYPLDWTVNVTAGNPEDVTIVKNEKTITVDVNEAPEEELQYTLTATLSEGEQTYSISLDYFVSAVAKQVSGPTKVEEPKTGVAYKFALYQTNRGEYLYFAGKMSGNYFATTPLAMDAVDVYIESVEDVEGGVRFYFYVDGVKNYLDINEYAEGKAGVRITTEPSAVFTYSEDAKTYVANVAGEDRYLGTYNTYNTISASSTSYITGSKAGDVGVKQFVAGFYTAYIKSVVVEAPKTGVAYKFALDQVNRGETLYFSGKMSGNYFATTVNGLEATDVFIEDVEDVEGGVRFYFYVDGVKNYLDINEYAEGKAGVRITTEPSAVFTYSEDAKTYVANVAGEDRYLGTYNTYNTISASSTSYITGSKAGDVGVKQFVAGFRTLAFANKKVDAPAADTGYKFALDQVNRGETLYFAGKMSGNYFATTTNAFEAVDVYVETVEDVEGGVRFYFYVDGVKNYLDINEYAEGKAGVRITTEPSAVFTYSEDAKTYVANVAGEDRYLGTYNTYNTISASSTSYITGSKAGDVGVKQFVAYFCIADLV